MFNDKNMKYALFHNCLFTMIYYDEHQLPESNILGAYSVIFVNTTEVNEFKCSNWENSGILFIYSMPIIIIFDNPWTKRKLVIPLTLTPFQHIPIVSKQFNKLNLSNITPNHHPFSTIRSNGIVFNALYFEHMYRLRIYEP